MEEINFWTGWGEEMRMKDNFVQKNNKLVIIYDGAH